MTPAYDVFLHSEAVRLLRAIRTAHRKNLAAFIDTLSTNPFLDGDYIMGDASGRAVQIKIIGAYAVTFWADHAVKEIKILDIRAADQA